MVGRHRSWAVRRMVRKKILGCWLDGDGMIGREGTHEHDRMVLVHEVVTPPLQGGRRAAAGHQPVNVE